MFKKILCTALLSAMMLSCTACGASEQPNQMSTEPINGYQYAQFKKYNSYAEENGLDGDKIYIKGIVEDVKTLVGVTYLTVTTNDGQWTAILGYTDLDCSTYSGKDIYAFGMYTGFSDKTHMPCVTVEKVKCGNKENDFNRISDYYNETFPAETTKAFSSSNDSSSNQIDHREMSDDEFTKKIADDFSTDKVKFTIDTDDEESYTTTFFKTKGADDKLINLNCFRSDYVCNIDLSFYTDDSDDACYDVLAKALDSDLFGFSFDDQVEILANYKLFNDYEYENKSGSPKFKVTLKNTGSTHCIFFASY